MLRLHLGCGWRDFGENWVHIDGGDYPHLKSKDITNLPYEDNSVDLIYSSHTLEYFDREEVKDVLREWFRVLKPEGELYLSVPDFRVMAELYLKDNIPLHKFLGPMYGRMEMDKQIIYHKTIYDYSSLGELLRFIGFKRIDLWDRDEAHQWIDWNMKDDHSDAKINDRRISLNIKCQK